MNLRFVLRLLCLSLLTQTLLISCASDDKGKKRERVPPTVGDSTLPWNRPPKWEGNARYGSFAPTSR